jgi:hypothetical protein
LLNILKPARKLEDATKLWESETDRVKRARSGILKRAALDRAKAAQPAVEEAERALTVAKGKLEDATSHALLAEEARAALLQ